MKNSSGGGNEIGRRLARLTCSMLIAMSPALNYYRQYCFRACIALSSKQLLANRRCSTVFGGMKIG
jgi:hypothetical protein